MLFNLLALGISLSFFSNPLFVASTQPNMVTPPPSVQDFTFVVYNSNPYVINRLDTVKLDKAENICKGANGNVFVVAPMDVVSQSKTYAYKIGSDGKLSLRGTIYHGGVDSSWGSPNSCYVSHGVLAVAVGAEDNINNGRVYFYNEADLSELSFAEVGAGPDMVVATPDGTKFVVANEGEPNANLQDPVGGISIIDATTRTVQCTFVFDQTISETVYRANKVHRVRRAVSTNTDLEPEYITFNPTDSTKAYVGLQEANTIIIVSLDNALACDANTRILSINPLGWKDWTRPLNLIDASDRDLDGTNNKLANFQNLPIYSLYQPDDINGFVHNGEFYIVTANEGDGKAPGDFTGGGTEGPTNQNGDEMRVNKISSVTGVDADWTPFTIANIKDNINLGRATIVNSEGDEDGDSSYSDLVMEGGRSFSIWKFTTTTTELVYDSGGALDQLAYTYCVDNGLIATTGACYDGGREDNKGTEPESLEIVELNGKRLLFVGLERANIIALFDISDPTSPGFLQFVRDELNVGGASPAGLAAPEGLVSFSAETSPTGKTLLVASGETSLTITVFSIEQICTSTKKKTCLADKKCTWKKVGKTSTCQVFLCAVYPKKKLCRGDKRCTWNVDTCIFKPA